MLFQLIFLQAVFLTALLDSAVIVAVWGLGCLNSRPKPKLSEIMLAGVLPPVLTLPYFWFVFPVFVSIGHYVLYGEVLVVIIETLMLCAILRISLLRALALSIAVNLTSYLVGGYLYRFLPI